MTLHLVRAMKQQGSAVLGIRVCVGRDGAMVHHSSALSGGISDRQTDGRTDGQTDRQTSLLDQICTGKQAQNSAT